ncbi:hypothetical protein [Fangia hongkongensis]|uniref:hypothetical protein n=2 Tax=Fangia hongkongensis TaxID=270495 RepID=UPI00037B04A3|nr:hypothetical protein [Fangia hongkongensis]
MTYSETLYQMADDIFSMSSRELIDYDLNCCDYGNLKDELISQNGAEVGLVLYENIINHVDVDLMAQEYLYSRNAA